MWPRHGNEGAEAGDGEASLGFEHGRGASPSRADCRTDLGGRETGCAVLGGEAGQRETVAVRCRPVTAKTARSVVSRHIMPAVGTSSLAAVDRAHVRDLHQGLSRRLAIAEHDGQETLAHVDARRRVTDGAGTNRSLPLGADVPRAAARTVNERRGVSRTCRGCSKGRRQSRARPWQGPLRSGSIAHDIRHTSASRAPAVGDGSRTSPDY